MSNLNLATEIKAVGILCERSCTAPFYLLPPPPGICPYLAIRQSVYYPRVRRKRQFASPGTSYLAKQKEISHTWVSLENILFLTIQNANCSPEPRLCSLVLAQFETSLFLLSSWKLIMYWCKSTKRKIFPFLPSYWNFCMHLKGVSALSSYTIIFNTKSRFLHILWEGCLQ